MITRPWPESKDAARARLVALIEQELGGPVRCDDCSRPLHNLRSVLIGRGPTCRRKHLYQRPGGCS
jgi:Family of unknown function (DUF6011)